MNVNAPLKASSQLAKGCQPGVCALDDPAVASKPIIALDAFAGYAVMDTAAFEMSTAARVVVSLVCVQLTGPAARSAWLATHRWQGVNQLIEDHRIVTIGSCDAKDQRDALAFRDEMALAAKLSSVRRIGARVRAPRGLATQYGQRWHIETSYRELKRSLLGSALTLHSGTPPTVMQEVWGALLAYDLIRLEMAQVAREEGVPPTNLSFRVALNYMRYEWVSLAGISAGLLPKNLLRLRLRLAEQLLPKQRRGRQCPVL
jgi:hypothetical protein